MKIRKARKEDIEFILKGINEICKIEKEKIFSRVFLKRRINRTINEERILCMEEKDRPVAFIEFVISKKAPYGVDYEGDKENFCWINNMFVSKNLRGKGIGKNLFHEVKLICRKKKIKNIMLDVFDVNKKAEKFYLKEGFNFKIHILQERVR